MAEIKMSYIFIEKQKNESKEGDVNGYSRYGDIFIHELL